MGSMKTIKKITSLLANLNDSYHNYQARRLIRTSRYQAALEDLPPVLYHYRKNSAHREFKGIPQDVFFFARAAEGLLTFFDCVSRSDQPCALPSVAADSVWHAWLRISPHGLDAFCTSHFGRPIPHVEGAAMRDLMDGALANCLVQARRLEWIDDAGPGLPRLFLLDRKLCMPNGYWYKLADGKVAFREMDARGRQQPIEYTPPALEVAGLLGLGLISQEQHDEAMAKRSTNGSGCGSGCGSSASCGSSCGSGCGGGCGGGGD